MIAHEVNNSVAGIISLIENGKLRIENEASASERLTALSSFVSRFAEVVKIPQPQLQLCDLSEEVPQLQLCDLSEEVEACRPFLENLCTQAHVRLDFHLTDEAVPVHLDTVLFQQVLINIVKNAVEAASPPTPLQGERGVITIATYYQPANHSTPLPYREGHGGGSLVITDNGHGIPPAIAKNLFTPFFSTKPQGQGLGLLLIRDILTAHHCTFNLHTDPEDHLTRFTIQFPKK